MVNEMNSNLASILLVIFGLLFMVLIAINFWSMSRYKILSGSENLKKIFKLWIFSIISMFINFLSLFLLLWILIYYKKNRMQLSADDNRILKIIVTNAIYCFIMFFYYLFFLLL